MADKKTKLVLKKSWVGCPYSIGEVFEIDGEPKAAMLRHATIYTDEVEAKGSEDNTKELKAEIKKLKTALTKAENKITELEGELEKATEPESKEAKE